LRKVHGEGRPSPCSLKAAICAIPRIVPVLKAMVMLTLADFVLLQRRLGR